MVRASVRSTGTAVDSDLPYGLVTLNSVKIWPSPDGVFDVVCKNVEVVVTQQGRSSVTVVPPPYYESLMAVIAAGGSITQ